MVQCITQQYVENHLRSMPRHAPPGGDLRRGGHRSENANESLSDPSIRIPGQNGFNGKGRTFEAHGPYREEFYDAMFAQATKVMLPSFQKSSSQCHLQNLEALPPPPPTPTPTPPPTDFQLLLSTDFQRQQAQKERKTHVYCCSFPANN
jgi:hypothetical protein